MLSCITYLWHWGQRKKLDYVRGVRDVRRQERSSADGHHAPDARPPVACKRTLVSTALPLVLFFLLAFQAMQTARALFKPFADNKILLRELYEPDPSQADTAGGSGAGAQASRGAAEGCASTAAAHGQP